MTSNLFRDALSAELAATRNRIQELEQELARVTRERDTIKTKWEVLMEELNEDQGNSLQ